MSVKLSLSKLTNFGADRREFEFTVYFHELYFEKNDAFLPNSSYRIFDKAKKATSDIDLPFPMKRFKRNLPFPVGRATTFRATLFPEPGEGGGSAKNKKTNQPIAYKHKYKEKTKELVLRQTAEYQKETVYRDVGSLYFHLDDIVGEPSGIDYLIGMEDYHENSAALSSSSSSNSGVSLLRGQAKCRISYSKINPSTGELVTPNYANIVPSLSSIFSSPSGSGSGRIMMMSGSGSGSAESLFSSSSSHQKRPALSPTNRVHIVDGQGKIVTQGRLHPLDEEGSLDKSESEKEVAGWAGLTGLSPRQQSLKGGYALPSNYSNKNVPAATRAHNDDDNNNNNNNNRYLEQRRVENVLLLSVSKNVNEEMEEEEVKGDNDNDNKKDKSWDGGELAQRKFFPNSNPKTYPHTNLSLDSTPASNPSCSQNSSPYSTASGHSSGSSECGSAMKRQKTPKRHGPPVLELNPAEAGSSKKIFERATSGEQRIRPVGLTVVIDKLPPTPRDSPQQRQQQQEQRAAPDGIASPSSHSHRHHGIHRSRTPRGGINADSEHELQGPVPGVSSSRNNNNNNNSYSSSRSSSNETPRASFQSSAARQEGQQRPEVSRSGSSISRSPENKIVPSPTTLITDPSTGFQIPLDSVSSDSDDDLTSPMVSNFLGSYSSSGKRDGKMSPHYNRWGKPSAVPNRSLALPPLIRKTKRRNKLLRIIFGNNEYDKKTIARLASRRNNAIRAMERAPTRGPGSSGAMLMMMNNDEEDADLERSLSDSGRGASPPFDRDKRSPRSIDATEDAVAAAEAVFRAPSDSEKAAYSGGGSGSVRDNSKSSSSNSHNRKRSSPGLPTSSSRLRAESGDSGGSSTPRTLLHGGVPSEGSKRPPPPSSPPSSSSSSPRGSSKRLVFSSVSYREQQAAYSMRNQSYPRHLPHGGFSSRFTSPAAVATSRISARNNNNNSSPPTSTSTSTASLRYPSKSARSIRGSGSSTRSSLGYTHKYAHLNYDIREEETALVVATEGSKKGAIVLVKQQKKTKDEQENQLAGGTFWWRFLLCGRSQSSAQTVSQSAEAEREKTEQTSVEIEHLTQQQQQQNQQNQQQQLSRRPSSSSSSEQPQASQSTATSESKHCIASSPRGVSDKASYQIRRQELHEEELLQQEQQPDSSTAVIDTAAASKLSVTHGDILSLGTAENKQQLNCEDYKDNNSPSGTTTATGTTNTAGTVAEKDNSPSGTATGISTAGTVAENDKGKEENNHSTSISTIDAEDESIKAGSSSGRVLATDSAASSRDSPFEHLYTSTESSPSFKSLNALNDETTTGNRNSDDRSSSLSRSASGRSSGIPRRMPSTKSSSFRESTDDNAAAAAAAAAGTPSSPAKPPSQSPRSSRSNASSAVVISPTALSSKLQRANSSQQLRRVNSSHGGGGGSGNKAVLSTSSGAVLRRTASSSSGGSGRSPSGSSLNGSSKSNNNSPYAGFALSASDRKSTSGTETSRAPVSAPSGSAPAPFSLSPAPSDTSTVETPTAGDVSMIRRRPESPVLLEVDTKGELVRSSETNQKSFLKRLSMFEKSPAENKRLSKSLSNSNDVIPSSSSASTPSHDRVPMSDELEAEG